MSQVSILKYYSKRTAPLLPPYSSRVGHAPPANKCCVGRPRKVKQNSPAPEIERGGKCSGKLEAHEITVIMKCHSNISAIRHQREFLMLKRKHQARSKLFFPGA